MDATKNTGFTVILVESRWKGVGKLVPRGWAPTRDEANVIAEQWRQKSDAYYKVCSARQLKEMTRDREKRKAANRKVAAKKAAATRKTRGPNNFVCCPRCGAKSKKLWSEFGGLQTRQCQNGHMFEYDKWIADRAFWGPILGNGPIPEKSFKRPL